MADDSQLCDAAVYVLDQFTKNGLTDPNTSRYIKELCRRCQLLGLPDPRLLYKTMLDAMEHLMQTTQSPEQQALAAVTALNAMHNFLAAGERCRLVYQFQLGSAAPVTMFDPAPFVGVFQEACSGNVAGVQAWMETNPDLLRQLGVASLQELMTMANAANRENKK